MGIRINALDTSDGGGMNIKRGIFRIWVVLSLAWAIAVSAIFFDEIKSPYLLEKNYLYVEGANKFLLIPDHNSRTKMRETMTEVTFPNNVSWFVSSPVPDAKMKALIPDFLKTYVEPRRAEIRQKRVERTETAIMAALIPIAMIFTVGAALLWAFSGFSKTPEERQS